MRGAIQADRLSRRRVLGYGAAAAALAPQFASAQNAPLPQTGSPPGQTDSIAATSDAARHLTIPVMIGGKGPFHFVVDTGADRSVIADDVAVRLGLIRGHDVTVQGVVRALSSRLVAVADLTFGNITRRNLQMPILPRSLMGADGYLGLDAVDGSRVTLDFQDHLLEISTAHRYSAFRVRRPTEAYVPVRGNMGHLRSMNCRVDGVSATCFLDTGAEISVGNTWLFNALIADNPDYKVFGTVPITGITGGMMMGKVVRIHRIRLHSVTFTDAVVAIADMPIFDVWGLTRESSLLIGMNFLRQFARVSIDYGMKEIRFDLASIMIARRG